MIVKKKLSLLILFILCSLISKSQNKGTIYGTMTDEKGNPIELVNIAVMGYPIGTITNREGNYRIKVPVNKDIQIVYSCIGYETKTLHFNIDTSIAVEANSILKRSLNTINEVNIIDDRERKTNLTRINPKVANLLPDASGNIEAIIKTMPGVSSNNELSSQYSVRGGNYDENLVYVNDIEIYRPFLIRSGQQEGLSFINPDMVASILFSAGGFQSKYGDKMSSVLDIKYKKPYQFGGSASLSLLGGSLHLEGSSKNRRFTHITGFRYKTSQYMLNTLDTKGEYQPAFTDFQTFLTYHLTDNLEINFLGNFAQNKYTFIPESRNTSFGTISEALQLYVAFDGSELDRFATSMSAVSLSYKPTNKLELKLISSVFRTAEEETFDIKGRYALNELDKNIGSDNLGDSVANYGIGTFIRHARNFLDVVVSNTEHKGSYKTKNNALLWGIKAQNEFVKDKISEWRMIDSAGYSLPYSDTSVDMQSRLASHILLNTFRFSSYLQETYSFNINNLDIDFTGGLRFGYWNFNNELLFSERFSVALNPNWKTDILFKLSYGTYYQPPFYKELRDEQGILNHQIKSQKSTHYVIGSDLNFRAWNRRFKFISEIYYKKLENLIPYNIDNVKIKYSAKNNAHGFAKGIDLKVNGEFVKGVDSWASLSIMNTEEDLIDDYYYEYYNSDNERINFGYTENDKIVDSIRIEPGFIPRPSDQLINFALFFQDYLPRNPSFKMHLTIMFGSSLKFGPPDGERYQAINKMPPYRRVDIGFSKILIDENNSLKNDFLNKNVKNLWVSVEILNLLAVNNTISYEWITDIRNRQYAVPNFLTSRRLNIKIISKF
ncbi:MAG: TonB-dependent receptor plug domain-containing protein [Chlorobi bacterium]|nr:TonB-dependent receptor plug domain-containing protein [Chlorobiota bacterium]